MRTGTQADEGSEQACGQADERTGADNGRTCGQADGGRVEGGGQTGGRANGADGGGRISER